MTYQTPIRDTFLVRSLDFMWRFTEVIMNVRA